MGNATPTQPYIEIDDALTVAAHGAEYRAVHLKWKVFGEKVKKLWFHTNCLLGSPRLFASVFRDTKNRERKIRMYQKLPVHYRCAHCGKNKEA